jgi:hypothetical protein
MIKNKTIILDANIEIKQFNSVLYNTNKNLQPILCRELGHSLYDEFYIASYDLSGNNPFGFYELPFNY